MTTNFAGGRENEWVKGMLVSKSEYEPSILHLYPTLWPSVRGISTDFKLKKNKVRKKFEVGIEN